MATIKLTKKPPTSRKTEERAPLRPMGLKRAHPTLAKSQAQAADRKPRQGRDDRDPRRDPRGDSRSPPDARRNAPARDARGPAPGRDARPSVSRDAPRHAPRDAPRDTRREPERDPRAAPRREPPPPYGRDPREGRQDRTAPPRRDPRAEPPRGGPRTDGPPRGPRSEGPPRGPRFEGPRHDGPPATRRDTRPAPDDPQPRPTSAPQARRPYVAPVRAVPRVRAEPTSAPGHADPATELPRLSKRMSELGLASRREADDWIARGLVLVDGVVVDQLGMRVSPEQRISVDPEARNEQSKRVTIVLNKPLGIVSGQAEDGHLPAVTLIKADSRWAGDHHPLRFHPSQLSHLVPAGRLDLDSTGLLVLTQDGRIAKALIGADTEVEKEYVVHVAWNEQPDAAELNKVFPPEKIALMRSGLELDGQKLKPAKVSWANEQHLRFVLREGKRRQIRRMCEAVGLQVLELKRIRIGRIALGEVPPGQWRYLGPFEKF